MVLWGGLLSFPAASLFEVCAEFEVRDEPCQAENESAGNAAVEPDSRTEGDYQ